MGPFEVEDAAQGELGGRGTVPVHGALVALLVLAYAAQWYYGFSVQARFPQMFPTPRFPWEPATTFGAYLRAAILEQREWHRLVSHVFLHGGLMHLLMNSYGTYTLGGSVNNFFGSELSLFIYFLSGMGASVPGLCFGRPGPSPSPLA